MSGKKLKLVGMLFVLALTIFGLFPMRGVLASEMQSPSQQEAGANLLVNPGLEGIGKPIDNPYPNPDNWTRDTYTGAQYGEIFTPEGWVTWWSEEGDFKRPECKVIPNEHPFNADPSRIHQGYYSGMCFTFYGKQNAGYYQVVRNIPPGSLVEGSFYAHAWSCSEDWPPTSCGDPNGFYFRVGIDPNGGTDPFSSNIVWSSPYYVYDTYGYVGPVQATVGESGAATLFVQSYAKWALKHNDAYYDNASLKLLTPAETPTPTSEPLPPTSEVEPTPRPTATRSPDGAIVHTVVAGDTVFGLALEYDVTPDQIYELNNLDSTSFLQIGQELVISASGGAVATPTVAPTEETTEAEPTATVEPSEQGSGGPAASEPPAGKASVCVSAFYDENGDMFRQADQNEMLLPNAQINLLARSGPVDSRTTDGISEPWCFEELDPGNYILRHSPPPGYELADGGQVNFLLSEGQVLDIELGYSRAAEGEAPEGNVEESNPNPSGSAEETAPEEEGSGVTNVLNVVLRVSGFIVLALAIAVLVLFVLSRRGA
ncbi:MAG: LysM peptidoglycan-binding domain-containing protein [Anaerolineae bacterium]